MIPPMWPGGFHPSNEGGRELPTRFGSEPLIGYRTWRVRQLDGLGWRLRSLMYSYTWLESNSAVCLAQSNQWKPQHTTPAPHPACSCGFYILKYSAPVDRFEGNVRGRIRASGEVALTGRVIVCTEGYKAQVADILSPVFIDVDCGHKGCMGSVEWIQQPDRDDRDFWGWCSEHVGKRPAEEMTAAAPFISSMLDELRTFYPKTEFLTFHS